ncbi:thioredoxin [Brevibacillus reuszeri]|uniref:thioredoxin n=1 Tax=Brevibacillus reuszeri TaxID=54915 RepID=UPI0028986166|nr:thioredoxin [Brevibacillus reuszeri]
MAVVDITDHSFADEVKSESVVVVDFWAPWCGPCKVLAPVLEEIDKEIGDKLKIVKLNVDENKDLLGRFNIQGIPTLIIFKEGEEVERLVGFQPKEPLMDTFKKHI